jgi:hypothetical protein
MQYTDFVFLAYALIGVAYFLLYRFVFHAYFKWKMIHSIWLPLVVSVGSIALAASAFMSAGGWGDLIAVVLLMIFNTPVVAFFILFGIDALFTRKKKAVAK